MALAAFLLCIAAATSIAQKLLPGQFVWLWALLLSGTVTSMSDWVLQIRGDLPGIFFSLMAMRFLLSESPWAIVVAGIAAGLATQFKFTFVAALGAGMLWLLIRRRFKDLAFFMMAGFFASAGLYFVFWLHEPRMIQHLSLLRIGFIDPVGCLLIMFKVFREPIVPLAVLAIPLAITNLPTGRALISIFALISYVIAAVTDLHPGGNINYFFEALFAILPLAAIGVARLLRLSRGNPTLAFFVFALFLGPFCRPIWPDLSSLIRDPKSSFRIVEAENASFRRLQDALQGLRIFTTNERLALLDPAPALINAFSFWTINPAPIYHRIGAEEFDVVLNPSSANHYRGVYLITPGLHKAISDAYAPYCVVRSILVQLPRGRPANGHFLEKLKGIGCEPLSTNGSTILTW
jgi:hypothetical protein